MDIAITGGDLKAGDIVLNWPDEYRGRVGETIEVSDPNFQPDAAADGEQA